MGCWRTLGQILLTSPRPQPLQPYRSASEGQILLSWNRNSEADLFRYRVYRDTLPGFIYDTSKIIGVVSDTFFVDNLPDYYRAGTYYYKITAIDSAFNQSPASEEITVVVTGAAEGTPVVMKNIICCRLSNPFIEYIIPYRLNDGGM
jgi:fibronectin type 3 domain-containing protein